MAAEAKYDMTVYPIQMAVRSASDGASVHMVTLPSCDCADFINRRGQLTDDGTAITVCKHIREALARVGGWHREPEPEARTWPWLSRGRAVTLMTSAFLASDLVDRLLHAATGAAPISALVTIDSGNVLVKYDSKTRRYTVTLPAAQPLHLPADWHAAEARV